MKATIRASVARIASWHGARVDPVPRADWKWADYVVAEVSAPPGPIAWVELETGRMIQVAEGDRLLGALGARAATLQLTGSWEEVGEDGRMHVLTAAGLMGRMTSLSPFVSPPIEVQYVGHVRTDAGTANMRDFVCAHTGVPFNLPVLLIVGSSMSAGKTNSARIIIRRLKRMDKRVVAAKLTGAGRYRDVITMHDVGADAIFDFVDAGLPSSICPAEVFREAAERVLSQMAATDADVAIIEAGASPLEPYNGDTAVRLIRDHLRMTLLCASDPYAVVGMIDAFGLQPDLIGGIACNTFAGLSLVQRLTQLPALRLTDPAALPILDQILEEKLLS